MPPLRAHPLLFCALTLTSTSGLQGDSPFISCRMTLQVQPFYYFPFIGRRAFPMLPCLLRYTGLGLLLRTAVSRLRTTSVPLRDSSTDRPECKIDPFGSPPTRRIYDQPPPRACECCDFAIRISLVSRPGRPRYPVFCPSARGFAPASSDPRLATTPLHLLILRHHQADRGLHAPPAVDPTRHTLRDPSRSAMLLGWRDRISYDA